MRTLSIAGRLAWQRRGNGCAAIGERNRRSRFLRRTLEPSFDRNRSGRSAPRRKRARRGSRRVPENGPAVGRQGTTRLAPAADLFRGHLPAARNRVGRPIQRSAPGRRFVEAALRDTPENVPEEGLSPNLRQAWQRTLSRRHEELQTARELILAAIATRPGWAYHKFL